MPGERPFGVVSGCGVRATIVADWQRAPCAIVVNSSGHERRNSLSWTNHRRSGRSPGARGFRRELSPRPTKPRWRRAQDLARKAARPGPVLRGNEGNWANFRLMVQRPRLCAAPGGAGDRRRLPRQPGRQPHEDHPPVAVVGHRQNGLGSDQGYARGRVDAATADG
jgi:hypothetical protein